MASTSHTRLPRRPWRRAVLKMSPAWKVCVAWACRREPWLTTIASMPSPPPPYSPGQNPNRIQNVTSSPHLSANTFATNPPPPPPPPPPSDYTPSPSSRPTSGFFHSRPTSIVVPQSATSASSLSQFPPPPPPNGKRSASRDKLVSKFNLSFRRGNLENAGPSNIESLRISTSEALQRPPASPGIVPHRAPHQ